MCKRLVHLFINIKPFIFCKSKTVCLNCIDFFYENWVKTRILSNKKGIQLNEYPLIGMETCHALPIFSV
ncbi:MAG: hypothetical protein RLZZ28_578 [Bacteroidota bacterium]|jgi:hypothetical protein